MLSIAQQYEVNGLIAENKQTGYNIDMLIAKANYNTECSLLLFSSISEESVKSTINNAIIAAFKFIRKIVSKVLDIVFKIAKGFKTIKKDISKEEWVSKDDIKYAKYVAIRDKYKCARLSERQDGKDGTLYNIVANVTFRKQLRPLDREYTNNTKDFIDNVKKVLSSEDKDSINSISALSGIDPKVTVQDMTRKILENCFVFVNYEDELSNGYHIMNFSELSDIVDNSTIPAPTAVEKEIKDLFQKAEVATNTDAEKQFVQNVSYKTLGELQKLHSAYAGAVLRISQELK